MNGMQGEPQQMNQNQPQALPPQPISRDPRAKSTALACVLSAMPGLGQVYVGYYQRGFIHIAVVGAILILLNLPGGYNPLIPGAAIFMAFFWLYNIIDAGRRAVLYNLALAGGHALEMPEDVKMPAAGGSILGGLVLIVAGFILLLNTGFGFSLVWLKDWWPVGGILVGIYLLAKGILDRNEAQSKAEAGSD
jgi:hypothetical protein